MAWLLRGADVLASLEVANTSASRRKGLLGRDGIDGAIWLEGTRWVHTLGMRFPIDVAYVDAEGTVLKMVTLKRHRIAPPCWRARAAVEAPAATFERWKLCMGDKLEVREG
jgi:uncharacterized membrane protein (UPF0127 family)